MFGLHNRKGGRLPNVLRDAREKLKNTNGGLTAALVLAALYFGREVFVPLALAGLLAFLLAPACTRLERWGIKRVPAALLVILLSLVGSCTLGWVVLGQVYNLAAELPQYQQNIVGKVDRLHLHSPGRLSGTVEMVSTLSKQIAGEATKAPDVHADLPRRRPTAQKAGALDPAAVTTQPITVKVAEPEESMLTIAGRTIKPLVQPLITATVVIIFLVFILLGRESFRDRALRLAGSGRIHVTTAAIEDASSRVSRFLQMQLVINICYGGVVGLVLWWIGIPHVLLWAVLTCILRFVPYIGIILAAAGPLLLSVAVSPNWTELVWTVAMFGSLEIITANFAEPVLYGATTGMSAIAILVAAIFWTLLWGLPGLLLSTPLTVCLIVIGRQVPQLNYLEVLFGEETELPPSERFYQRLLVSNVHDATSLLVEQLKTKSLECISDDVLVPALTQIEEARHAEEVTSARADELLLSVEEILEDIVGRTGDAAKPESLLRKRVACVPARDFGDEIASQMAQQALAGIARVRVFHADSATPDMLQSLNDGNFDVICVIGIPPRALRYIRMRCHQIRNRFPDAVIVACLLSKESDLSNLRSRVPTEDAQHVVCSLQLMKTYIVSILNLDSLPVEASTQTSSETRAGTDLKEPIREIQIADVLDGTEEDIFGRLTADLARSFDAPIALITVMDGQRRHWEAQCGLPEQTLLSDSERDVSVCSKIVLSEGSLFISDINEDERFSNDAFVISKGIRFYAGTPLKAQDGEVMGSLCVLDTRPRDVTDEQKAALTSIASSVMTAIELQAVAEPETKSKS